MESRIRQKLIEFVDAKGNQSKPYFCPDCGKEAKRKSKPIGYDIATGAPIYDFICEVHGCMNLHSYKESGKFGFLWMKTLMMCEHCGDEYVSPDLD